MMKREPSIHITKNKFIEILGEYMPKGFDTEKLASAVFKKAKPYSAINRQVSVTSDRIEKKTKKLLSSSRLDADLFAQLIFYVRKKMKHRGISPIKPGGKDWALIKEITATALEFCEEFELQKREGFIKFIEIGAAKMNKFSITKFQAMYEGICETYIAMDEIAKDEDKDRTAAMYKYYIQHIAEYTGIYENLEALPEKYVWFVRANQVAQSIGVSPETYIKAQFSGLDFAKGIPHPTQLVGDKAIERVNRYTYKKNFKGEYNSQGVRRISLRGI